LLQFQEIKMTFKKGQLNISFGWIFAIIVGAFIIFLVIYGITKFSGIQQTQQSAETSRSIEVLLNPLETGFETAQKVTISTPSETKIYLQCSDSGKFGNQKIMTRQKILGKYSGEENSVNVTIISRYIFSESPIEGKNFFAFSKPYEFPSEEDYEFPFKIADLIYLTSLDENYCFKGSIPEGIEEEISELNQENLFLEDCPSGSINVCFGSGSNCDVEVNYKQGIIEKDSGVVFFEGDALMYAGIFSDIGEYECQLSRLMKRAEQLVIIYQEKNVLDKSQGCLGGMESDLVVFENLLRNFGNSEDIFVIGDYAERLNKLNSNQGSCRLW